jgi:CTP:phosphocholine cytidylyltransferase-like protein
MREYWKTIAAISFIFALIVLFGSYSFSQEEKGTMRQKGMMESMDKMMGQCNQMMENMDMMMGQKMSSGCMGMMNMQGMGMMMHNMSQNMKGMMENMDSMMNNPEMMKDEVMKKDMEQMQEHMKKMTEHMQGAMDNVQEITKRMEMMESK